MSGSDTPSPLTSKYANWQGNKRPCNEGDVFFYKQMIQYPIEETKHTNGLLLIVKLLEMSNEGWISLRMLSSSDHEMAVYGNQVVLNCLNVSRSAPTMVAPREIRYPPSPLSPFSTFLCTWIYPPYTPS